MESKLADTNMVITGYKIYQLCMGRGYLKQVHVLITINIFWWKAYAIAEPALFVS